MSNYPYPELQRAYVDALGIHTAYYETGSCNGRPVMLLHGMTSSGDVFREALHELSDALWLIAPDLPGFGYSDYTEPYTLDHLVEWLAAFREALDLPPMVLAGHSFGGALATAFTASYPQDVARLLLVAPAVAVAQTVPNPVKKAGISLGLVDLGTVMSQSRALVRQQIRQPFYAPDEQDEGVWERRLLAYDQARASADVIKALAFEDLRPFFSRIQQPTCVLWGQDDNVLPVSQADELLKLREDIVIHKLPACAHVVMLEQQAAFQAAVRAFAQEADMAQAVATALQATSAQVVSVFGSSAPQPGEPAYEEARRVGRLLAEAGFAVATGGYIGTMTAVSQGASEVGGHVIGVTSEQIERFRPIGPNEFVTQEVRYETLRDRLLHLVVNNDGIIVLPGGIGTLSEMSLAWSFLQTGEMPPRPMALLGDLWHDTMLAFESPDYVKPEHMALLYLANSPETAVAHIVNNCRT